MGNINVLAAPWMTQNRAPISAPFTGKTDNRPCKSEDRVNVNICGMRYEVPAVILAEHPDTLLGDRVKMWEFYDPCRNEYYFDRNRTCFESILSYYQSGALHRPQNVPLRSFVAESRFFQLDKAALLQICEEEGFQKEEPARLPKNTFQKKLWLFVDNPDSSFGAKLFSLVSLFVILLSVVILCLASLPQFRTGQGENSDNNGTWNDTEGLKAAEILGQYAQFRTPFFMTSSVCIGWFTIELVLRFAASPDKKHFLKSPINIIDVIAVVPYYIDVAVTVIGLQNGNTGRSSAGIMGILRVLRVIRVFRIVRISRYSRGLRLLGRALTVSLSELGLLMLFLGIGVVLFSSAVYFAEQGVEDTQFRSIPEAFWWAIVTSKSHSVRLLDSS